MHIYVERMHALIHMCHVLYNKAFKKNPIILLRGHQNFQWQNCKEIAPSNPNWLEFGHCKVFEVHKAEKGPEITIWHGKWEDPENGRVWKWIARDTREDCSNEENGDKLNKRGRDYWWSRSTKEVYILKRQHWSSYCAKSEQPWWTRRVKKRSVWTVWIRQCAIKMRPPGQEAERNRRCERSRECGP